jgi:uroporphyrinogen III methyltransferase / synthase
VSGKIGKVYLVGAGPGDPNLITVKGRACLEEADVILYDRLVSPSLINRIPPHVEKVYVGKLPNRHLRPQEEINELLIRYAMEGKTVTRLKGGDPFVFGRGGEEAEALAAHGIPFEIVPGVTSAIAVPAYAGIPVTHREYTTSFAVVTGHEDPLKGYSSIDWQQIGASKGTTVFLMGVGQLRSITARILEHGGQPQTPVALIRWGTRVEQETLTGTLDTIADLAEAHAFKGPAVIVIGEVVRLRSKIAWFEQKPLFGKRIVVTRARKQASALSEQIERLGGEAYEFPVIEIVTPKDLQPLQDALRSIGSFQWVVFTSANGVDACFRQMQEMRLDIRSWANVKVAAIGDKTADVLAKRGLIADLVPASFVAEALVESLLPMLKKGDRVLLPRADIARKHLPEALRSHGCDVVEVDAYETKRVADGASELVEMLQKRAVHYVTFTSSSTVRNFLETIREQAGEEADALLKSVKTACIGPITAATASELGLHVDIVASTYTIEGLVEAVVKDSSESNFNLKSSSHEVIE